MHKKLSAEQVLVNLIAILETNLTELISEEFKNEYVVGEWYAYIECLEAIFCWKKAEKFGLNYNPEKRFNIIQI